MAQRVFFFNTLHDSTDLAEYEDWIRRVDYPIARKQDAINSYVVTRIDGFVSGAGESPYHYLEIIEITDIEAYRAIDNPEFKQLLEEWSTYVAESVMVYGEVIE